MADESNWRDRQSNSKKNRQGKRRTPENKPNTEEKPATVSKPASRPRTDRVLGTVHSVTPTFCLVLPSAPFPAGYTGRFVLVRSNLISEVLIPLKEHDEVDCALSTHVKEKPVASNVSVVRYNQKVSPSELQAYLERVLNLVRSNPQKEDATIVLASCASLWELLGRSCSSQTVLHTIQLHIHILRSAPIRSDASDSTKALFSTQYAARKGPLAQLLQSNRSASLIGYLVLVLKTCPALARKVTDILELRAKTYDDVRDSEAILMYTLLKESSRAVAGLLEDADVNDIPWDSLPLVPHQSELASEHFIQIALSPVKVGQPYESFDEYMDTYFRLLRADCFLSTAKGIRGFLNTNIDLRDMNIFYDLHLTGIYLEPLEGALVLILRVKPVDTRKKWNKVSSSLMHGNLVCLSASGAFEDPLFASIRDHAVLPGNNEIEVALQPIEGREACQKAISAIRALLSDGKAGVMVESPVYYVSVGPALKALQSQYSEIPFESEIVFGSANNSENLSPHVSHMLPLVRQFEAGKKTLKFGKYDFEASQAKAFCQGLTKRLAIIQGPPGTGKTFIGSQILSAILQQPQEQPILVLTYKNHALDEFVKHMQKICGDNSVVRVGGKSKDPSIEAVNLRELRKVPKSKELYAEFKKVVDEQYQLEQTIQKLFSELVLAANLNLNAVYRKFSLAELGAFLVNAPWTDKTSKIFNKSSKKQVLDLIKREWGYFNDGSGDDNLFALWKMAFSQWLPSKATMGKFQDLSDVFDKIEKIRQGPKNTDNNKAKETKRVEESAEESDEDEEEAIEKEKERKMLMQTTERRNVTQFSLRAGTATIGLGDFSAKYLNAFYAPCLSDEDSEDVGGDESVCSNGNVQPTPRFQEMWQKSGKQRTEFVARLLCDQVDEVFTLLSSQMTRYRQLGEKRKTLERLHEKDIIQDKAVLAMTITGASIHNELLRLLQPEIVLVEEAAEILEPQLIAALGPWTKHLILIGDHQQLRPNVENMEMKKLKFEVSLFERLVRLNYPHVTLEEQNRMRPEMADLLLDIYPNLRSNKQRVSNNMIPKCVGKSMYFWNVASKEVEDRGFSNPLEADAIVALVKFLMNHGVDASKVTVLAAYLAQTRLLRNRLREEGQHQRDLYFKDVSVPSSARDKPGPSSSQSEPTKEELKIQVNTIDSYQGDENDVILVSLVRSNPSKKAGFLKEMNRRCVAQSRARCMFIFVGNFGLVKSIPCWRYLMTRLEEQHRVGSAIELRCEYHPTESVFFATSGNELSRLAALVFCTRPCLRDMACRKHPCPNPCQPAHSHKKCEATVTYQGSCGHSLTRKCYQKPSSIDCLEDVVVQLNCQHWMKKKCFQDKDEIRCTTVVSCFYSCGIHKKTVECHEAGKRLICNFPCQTIFKCKHPCDGKCGQPCSPESCRLCLEIRRAEEKRKLEEERKKKEAILKNAEIDIARLVRDLAQRPERQRMCDELDKNSAEYMSVQDRVLKYIQPGHNWYPTVVKIEKVTNRHLELEWLNAHKDMVDPSYKDDKFHGTSKEGVDGITRYGFKLPEKSGMFGKGVYFATDSSKSAQEIYTKQSNMLLLCDVLLGRTLNVNKATDMDLQKLRKMGYDSLFARRDTKDQGGVLHDEFVVYDPRQAIPRYVIHYGTISATASNFVLPRTQMSFISNLLNRSIVKDLFPKRTFDPTDSDDLAFRMAEAQFLRLRTQSSATFGQRNLVKVGYVQNPRLEDKFMRTKNALEKHYGKKAGEEILVFHGTSCDQNIDSIVANNFDTKKITRCAYGYGMYFSELPDVSLSYAGSTNKLLLCRLLPGNTQLSSGPQTTLLHSCHSIGANPTPQGQYQILVITNMDQVLPAFILHLG